MSGRFEEELEHREYLGDGVYAGWDGYHVVLYLENSGVYSPDGIGLEPNVLQALDRYRRHLKEVLGDE